MRISKGTYQGAKYAVETWHYSHAIPSAQYIYNVWNDDGLWCGVIIYSTGANKSIASPFDKWQGQVLELVRVALNGNQGHGNTSTAVAMSLKALHREAPWVDIVVSYADLDQGHAGTLYQATNWIYTGLTNANSVSAFVVKGKKTHRKTIYSRGWKESLLWLREHVDPKAEEFITLGKHKYVYPMTKKIRKRLMLLSVPYPKKDVI